jgi:hypothetical protein
MSQVHSAHAVYVEVRRILHQVYDAFYQARPSGSLPLQTSTLSDEKDLMRDLCDEFIVYEGDWTEPPSIASTYTISQAIVSRHTRKVYTEYRVGKVSPRLAPPPEYGFCVRLVEAECTPEQIALAHYPCFDNDADFDENEYGKLFSREAAQEAGRDSDGEL